VSDPYVAAVLAEVFRRGGDTNAVSLDRCEMCEAVGTPPEEVARMEVELQEARAQLARDIARLTVVEG
jgi:hypothetical protein